MKINWKILVISITLLFMSIVPVVADELRMKNGDRISGTVIRMEDEKLIFKTSYTGEISINWADIATITTDSSIKIVLSDESVLSGVAKPAQNGTMKLEVEKTTGPVSFDLAEVKSINPVPEPPIKFKGYVNVGANVTKGNTDTETFHINTELIARTVKNRFTIGGELNYGTENGEETADNAIGFIKYDHFLTKKWYLYSNASFERDDFKDIKLRTALGVGAGYQFLELPLTNLSTEAGVNYINEDFDDAEDGSYPAGRWAVTFDIYLLKKIIQFFHFHEGFVGFEDAEDIFIRSRTGFRFLLYKNFFATTQVNWDWDNTPAPGRKRTDEMYLFTLGYKWGE